MNEINLSYEKALEELEEILEELEDEECTLNDSIDKFKRGIALYKYCNNLLNKAEGEIKILLGDEENMIENEFLGED